MHSSFFAVGEKRAGSSLKHAVGLALLLTVPASRAQMRRINNGVEIHSGSDVVQVDLYASNVAHMHVKPAGQSSPQTLVMDPHPMREQVTAAVQLHNASRASLKATGIEVQVDTTDGLKLDLCDREHHCIHIPSLLPTARQGELSLELDQADHLYGMRGSDLVDGGGGLEHDHGATIAAGSQGDGGGPFFFTKTLGVLVDSNGGAFQASGPAVRFTGCSRKDLEFYVAFGPPPAVVSSIVKLTGLPPMSPKWTLGFLNSQWGTDEAELRRIVATYRQKQIPLDGFILDFDWKAWGEDNYGEWRWNSTSGAGAASPDKFPDGASGSLAADLAKQGVRLSGILKPRILLSPAASSPDKRTTAAAFADTHHLWVANEKPEEDYFTHRPARNLDFALPETRTWFWEHLKPAFLTGMAGWWNDEADSSNGTTFSNFQFLNMGRMLYDGQRATADQRVWSINRNYYLGANRFGYALWSGDIDSGFPSMAYQRRRMLAAIDLGASHWSMDTGGFHGHPTPENYARWMEFAAWVPIQRVHGDFGEKRQPWTYGAVAEAAAVKAIRTRYALMPYLYSYERLDHLTGVGLVRPMFWIFPDDMQAASLSTQWMFGDALLVSPVVEQGATKQHVYLPAGRWHNFTSGELLEGGRGYDIAVDPQTWADTPVFVREGSIVASQEPQQYVNEHPVQTVTLDVFPGERPAAFTYYDDDGISYRYEKGDFFEQKITAQMHESRTEMHFASATGRFSPALTQYLVRVHTHADKITVNGRALPSRGNAKVNITSRADTDKYGAVTVLTVRAGVKLDLEMQ